MAQFITWLKNQQDRSDAIGRLAMAASRDQEFPKANKLNSIVDYLKRKGANDKLLDTVENAYAEFESAPRRKSRKAVPEATTGAKAAPKPAEFLSAKPPQKRATPIAAAPRAEPVSAPKNPPAKQNKAMAPEKASSKTAQPTTSKASGISKTEAAKSAKRNVPAGSGVAAAQPRQPRAEQSKTEPPQTSRATPAEPRQTQPEPRRTSKARTETAVAQLPERLLPLQRQLADASAVLDAQFGKGYSAKNAVQVLDFARMLLTSEQNRMLHFTFADLAEALHRVASRLDNMMRQPY